MPVVMPSGVFHSMGETHIEHEKKFDVWFKGKLIDTVETFDEARKYALETESDESNKVDKTKACNETRETTN